ncbi:hypothetical protein BKA65DRAFT_443655 [Rhexocercosporidium sp. MPI-PUGE-AT-0058]|nr:hypothetical protein BKA65DRAFT_443655 [Rhexocercosporidium sp. MPI-PUGE-AT-0058]
MRLALTTLVNSAYRAFRIAPTVPLETPIILPPEHAIEEEQIPDFNPYYFYPANPGEVLNKRYKTIVKLRWGSYSTVWLARDVSRWRWRSKPYVALKINNCVLPIQYLAWYRLVSTLALLHGEGLSRMSLKTYSFGKRTYKLHSSED